VNNKNYTYENNIFNFESCVGEFNYKLFQEFDSKAENLDLKLKIEDLINGEVVNKTENQAAWHPKYRKKGPISINILYKHIQNIRKKHKKGKINILTIGIGGSYEGPKLLIESLKSPESREEYNFQFLTGSDMKEFTYKTSLLDPKMTIFIISSKSFTTDETIQMLKSAIDWSPSLNNFIVITSNVKEANKYGFNNKNIVSFDKEIGGRYSIWSPIAQIPLLEKNSYELFINGGNFADQELINNKEYLRFIKQLSFTDIWLHNNKNKSIRVVLSYIWSLRSFANYVQQLEMESLGKHANSTSEYTKTGQTIFGGYGPTAQHSYFQLLHQGTGDICADIISSKEDPKSLSYAQSIVQSKLLSYGAEDLKEEEKINANVPVNLFLLKKLDPFTIGYLVATWEHRVFVTATMLEINPFDQFGVSAGKLYTKKYLKQKN
tara:strand:- start:40647 stop:41951 length:1305 start_codon:yes stop_codon:yes gene_type:complete